LAEKSPRKQRRRTEENRKQENPNANVARIKRAQEDTDKTIELLPSPQMEPGWVQRFGAISEARLKFDPDEQFLEAEAAEAAQPRKVKGQRSRRPFKYNPNQRKMF
jgi:hypothetical protein